LASNGTSRRRLHGRRCTAVGGLLLLGSSVLQEVHGVRHQRRGHAPDQRPVDTLEERVLLDLRGAPGEGDPLLWVLDEQAADEVPGDGADRRGPGRAVGRGEAQRLLDDVAQRGAVAGALEGRGAVQELVEEDAQRPPVHRAAVALAADDLRRQVLVRADERHGPHVRRLRVELHRDRAAEPQIALGRLPGAPGQDAREEGRRLDAPLVGGDDVAVRDVHPSAGGVHRRRRLDQRRAHGAAQRQVEVREHDVAVLPDQHVLRLEVPVHDPQHVQVLHGQQHLGDVEPGGGLGEVLAGLLLAERVEVAAAAVLHDEAVELVRLEVRVERGEEGVVEEAEDLALRLRAGHLVPADDGRLVHHLHGEEGPRGAELRQVHAADVAVAQALEQPEVGQVQRRVLGRGGQLDGVPPAVAAGVPPDVGRRGARGGAAALHAVAPPRPAAVQAGGVSIIVARRRFGATSG
jgi:hypothetical protein